MTTRDAFLAKIRAAQPAPRPRPEVPLFPVPEGDRRERFTAALALMGGTCVDANSLDDVRALICGRFGPDAVVADRAGHAARVDARRRRRRGARAIRRR
jgi:L-lactate dehydrogenase complex protein LldG